MKNVPDGTLFNRQFCVGAPQNCCDRSGKITYAILPRGRSKRRSDMEGTMQTEKELPVCPVETTLMLIGDKWKVLILRDLMPGTKRFGELKKSIGSVSQKVLTAQLRDMEAKGLVDRRVYAEVPPRVEYSLTELGRSLKPILDAMWTWGEGYKAQNSRGA